MISTGFSALDKCIGGLKKGKLYCLAGFNFTPECIAEHFAINHVLYSNEANFIQQYPAESGRKSDRHLSASVL